MKRLLIIALSALLAGGSASAQDSDGRRRDRERGDEAAYFDRTPEDCIRLSRLRDTEIIDESTILFYMRGGRVYRNVMERGCPGLNPRRILAFTAPSVASSGRLCRSNTLQHFGRLDSFDPGAFCRVGLFHPITREEAELIELEPDELSVVRSTSELTPIDPDDGQPLTDETAAPADERESAPLE